MSKAGQFSSTPFFLSIVYVIVIIGLIWVRNGKMSCFYSLPFPPSGLFPCSFPFLRN